MHFWKSRVLALFALAGTMIPCAVASGSGVAPVRGWWLVVRTSNLPDHHQLPALLAETHAGHVTELVLNIHAEGD